MHQQGMLLPMSCFMARLGVLKALVWMDERSKANQLKHAAFIA